jgi:hypothetical protein
VRYRGKPKGDRSAEEDWKKRVPFVCNDKIIERESSRSRTRAGGRLEKDVRAVGGMFHVGDVLADLVSFEIKNDNFEGRFIRFVATRKWEGRR